MTTQYNTIPPARRSSESFSLMPATANALESFLIYGYYPLVSGQPSIDFPGQLQMMDDESFVQNATYRPVQTPGYPLGPFPSDTVSKSLPGQPLLVEQASTLTDAHGNASLAFTMTGTGAAFITLLMGDSHRSFQVNVYSSALSKFFLHNLPALFGFKIKRTMPLSDSFAAASGSEARQSGRCASAQPAHNAHNRLHNPGLSSSPWTTDATS